MTPDDDPLDGMHRFDRDDELFDRLLDGTVDPDDAPDELAEVAALVRQAGGEAAPRELADEDWLVAAMAAVLPDVADVPEPSSSRVGSTAVIHRLLRAKVATVVVVSAVGLGAAAAAVSTSGESSRPEVEAADTTMVQVTVATTSPTTATTTTSTTTTTTSTTSTTTSTTAAPSTSAAPPVTVDPAIVALCQAWKAGHQTKPPAPPSAELIAAAKAAGKSVDDFCERALGEKERHDREEADRRERDRRDQEEKDRERRKKEDEDRRHREGDHGDTGGRGDGGGEGHDRG